MFDLYIEGVAGFIRFKVAPEHTETDVVSEMRKTSFVTDHHKLIIELDWNIHSLKEIYELDKYKESLLLNLWYKIIRFKNEEIHNELVKSLFKIAASFSW